MDCGELGRRDEVIGSVAFSLSEVHARTHGVGASSVPAAARSSAGESPTGRWPTTTRFTPERRSQAWTAGSLASDV